MPPPSRSVRNAICDPSGEKAGSPSSSGESAVRLVALAPPMRCRKMSRSPPSRFTNTNDWPSGETLAWLSAPAWNVSWVKLAVG